MTSRPNEAQHLRDLGQPRRVRDRMDREYDQLLDVEALARGVNMSAGHLSRQFRRANGESPYSYLERLQAGKAEVVQEPTDQPYGVRDCAFRDPAGNLLRIQELR